MSAAAATSRSCLLKVVVRCLDLLLIIMIALLCYLSLRDLGLVELVSRVHVIFQVSFLR